MTSRESRGSPSRVESRESRIESRESRVERKRRSQSVCRLPDNGQKMSDWHFSEAGLHIIIIINSKYVLEIGASSTYDSRIQNSNKLARPARLKGFLFARAARVGCQTNAAFVPKQNFHFFFSTQSI